MVNLGKILLVSPKNYVKQKHVTSQYASAVHVLDSESFTWSLSLLELRKTSTL